MLGTRVEKRNKHVPQRAKLRAGETANPEGKFGRHLGPWAHGPPPTEHPRKRGLCASVGSLAITSRAPEAAVYPGSRGFSGDGSSALRTCSSQINLRDERVR